MEEAVAPNVDVVKKSFLNISTKLILALVFFVPVLVIPISNFPFQFTKTTVVLVVTLILLGLFLKKIVHEKQINFFFSPLLISFFALPIVYLISSIFSSQPGASFYGYQLGTDTFGFILFGVVLVSLILVNLTKKSQIFLVLMSILVSAIVVYLFQLTQVFFGAPLPVASLNNPIVNLVGRWNDLGVFAGLIGSLSLLAIESFPLQKREKVIVLATFLISTFFIVLVNLNEVWVLFGVVSLAVFILSLAKGHFSELNKISFSLSTILAGLGLLLSVFFLFFGGGAATRIQNTFGINALEVRPSIEGTLDVLSGVYKESPIVGSGPNTFSSNWLLYRPEGVMQTPFWNTNFGTGSGIIPTSFVTGGILVALGWVAFSLLLIYTIFKALFSAGSGSGRSYMLTAITALGSFYLLVIHYVYSPSQSLTILFFIFFALFLSSIRDTNLMKLISLSGVDSPRVSFGFMLGAVFIGILSLGILYDTGKTYLSILNHEKAIQLANSGNYEESSRYIERAISLRAQDRYYRTASLIQVSKLNSVVQGGASSEEAQTDFQNALAGAIQYTGFAIQNNPDRFENWFARALVYATVVPLRIDGAYENALATLEEARIRSPKSPEVDLRLAEVHQAQGSSELARNAIAVALDKKADYTQAILFKARIELSEGELDEAIESVRGAVFFEPQNPVLLYQLGILFLQDENYSDATSAFELALQSQPDYANAAFFLAQSYSFLDRIDDAFNIMDQLSILNPGNETVLGYRDQLADGINPFKQGEIESLEGNEVEVN